MRFLTYFKFYSTFKISKKRGLSVELRKSQNIIFTDEVSVHLFGSGSKLISSREFI